MVLVHRVRCGDRQVGAVVVWMVLSGSGRDLTVQIVVVGGEKTDAVVHQLQ